MPMTLVFMFIFGIAIQILILRPMIGEPIISVIMVTIGLSTVFQASRNGLRRQPAAIPACVHQPVRRLLGLQSAVYVNEPRGRSP